MEEWTRRRMVRVRKELDQVPAELLSYIHQHRLRQDVAVVGQVERVDEILRPRQVDRRRVGRADQDETAGLEQTIEALEHLPGILGVLEHVLREDDVVAALEQGAVLKLRHIEIISKRLGVSV